MLPFFLERYAAAYRAELDAFIAAVNAGQASKPDGEDGLKALLLADAATQSATSGQAVSVALDDAPARRGITAASCCEPG